MLFLDGTQYETRNSKRPGIAFYQWPQFYLDNYATVNEVIANLDQVQVVNTALGEEYPGRAAAARRHRRRHRPVGHHRVHQGRAGRASGPRVPGDDERARLRQADRQPAALQGLRRHDRRNCPAASRPRTASCAPPTRSSICPRPAIPAQAAANMMSLMNNVSVPFGSPYSGVSGTYPTWYRSIIDPDSRLYYVQTTITPNTFWVEMDKLDLKPGAAPRKLSDLRSQADGRGERRLQGSKARRSEPRRSAADAPPQVRCRLTRICAIRVFNRSVI